MSDEFVSADEVFQSDDDLYQLVQEAFVHKLVDSDDGLTRKVKVENGKGPKFQGDEGVSRRSRRGSVASVSTSLKQTMRLELEAGEMAEDLSLSDQYAAFQKLSSLQEAKRKEKRRLRAKKMRKAKNETVICLSKIGRGYYLLNHDRWEQDATIEEHYEFFSPMAKKTITASIFIESKE